MSHAVNCDPSRVVSAPSVSKIYAYPVGVMVQRGIRLYTIPIAKVSTMTTRKGNNPRRANSSRRNKIRARIKAEGEPCALCGLPIDYSLPPGDPMAFEVDEIVPVSLGGNPLDITNCQAVHRICNQRKGNRLYATTHPPTTGGQGTQGFIVNANGSNWHQ